MMRDWFCWLVSLAQSSHFDDFVKKSILSKPVAPYVAAARSWLMRPPANGMKLRMDLVECTRSLSFGRNIISQSNAIEIIELLSALESVQTWTASRATRRRLSTIIIIIIIRSRRQQRSVASTTTSSLRPFSANAEGCAVGDLLYRRVVRREEPVRVVAACDSARWAGVRWSSLTAY